MLILSVHPKISLWWSYSYSHLLVQKEGKGEVEPGKDNSGVISTAFEVCPFLEADMFF